MMRGILRRLKAEQSGLSMTELLVAMFLTLIILAMVGNFFLSTAKITAMSNQNRASNDVASNVVTEIAASIRVSTDLVKADDSIDYAIVSGSTTSKLIVYSLSNTDAKTPGPSKITFELLGTAPLKYVQETRCVGTASGTVWVFTSPCTVRNLGVGILDSDLFTYLDGSGNVIPITAGSSDAQRDSVASITVRVRAQAAKATASPVIITNTVVLRNLGLDTVT